MGLSPTRTGVLVLAGDARWEAEVLPALGEAGFAVVKRCVDVADLMATAGSGQAALAVVDGDVRGLDSEVVLHLLRHDVRTLAVLGSELSSDRLGRLGVVETVRPESAGIVGAAQRVVVANLVLDPAPVDAAVDPSPPPSVAGRVVAVWGPTGAPGRTTVSAQVAALAASAGAATVLVDADPYGGSVAQHLGMLDEVSGVLAAARLANAGGLDEGAFAGCARKVADGLVVLTGLPRADRRIEVRTGLMERILDAASHFGEVVVDCGFCLEEDELGMGRDQMTLEAISFADVIVVVGSAEPTGLARLARGLAEIGELSDGRPVHVVVNRMRSSLGWSERDILGMIEGYLRPASVQFLPTDQAGLDRALVTGKTLVELGESPLRKALADVAAVVLGVGAQAPKSR